MQATYKIVGVRGIIQKTVPTLDFKNAIRIGTDLRRKGYSVTIYTYNKETRKYEVK